MKEPESILLSFLVQNKNYIMKTHLRKTGENFFGGTFILIEDGCGV